MPRLPWFKLYAADFLTDPDVDQLPPEAQALLIKMWCVCCLRGSLPDDVTEVLRLTQLSNRLSNPLSYSLCKSFFETREGRLYSKRMMEEQKKSDIARSNGKQRGKAISSAISSANSLATSLAQKSESESDIRTRENPPNSPTNERPLSSDEIVWEIAKLHPDNAKLRHPTELPPVQLRILVERIESDGAEAVKAGTEAYRQQWEETPDEERKFTPKKFKDANEFWKCFAYREFTKEPEVEERLGQMDETWCARFEIPYKGRPVREVKREIEQRVAEWRLTQNAVN